MDFIEQVKKFQLPRNKRIKDFSTGMKAKVKVLVAVSHNAKLLILDEPTAGLDVIARDELLEMLRDFICLLYTSIKNYFSKINNWSSSKE